MHFGWDYGLSPLEVFEIREKNLNRICQMLIKKY
uniref:Uncharacterized protein n=1 Tax=Lepeophtheirus salmonis TaxID=72036 RepID=A0A0K2T3N8_LEPSM